MHRLALDTGRDILHKRCVHRNEVVVSIRAPHLISHMAICQGCDASGGSDLGFWCRRVQLLAQFGQADHFVHQFHHQGQQQDLSDETHQSTFALKQKLTYSVNVQYI